ncbi:MAG: MarR family winged helix-turn-helix transcriptional regulator [Pseudomonadota bacterium]
MTLKHHESGRAWVAVVRAYNTCSKAIISRIEPTGFSLLEHEILINLLLSPGQSQQQLAMKCFSAKSGISGIVSKFEERGIITRKADETDTRKKLLFLTDEGAELAKINFKIQNEIIEAMASVYTPEKIADLENGMNDGYRILSLPYVV